MGDHAGILGAVVFASRPQNSGIFLDRFFRFSHIALHLITGLTGLQYKNTCCKDYPIQSLDLNRYLYLLPGPCAQAIASWPRLFFWAACPNARYWILQLLIALRAVDCQPAVILMQIRYTYPSLRVLLRLLSHSVFQSGVETNPLKCACRKSGFPRLLLHCAPFGVSLVVLSSNEVFPCHPKRLRAGSELCFLADEMF